MDTATEPMDDLNLRKALLHAIEGENVANVAWEGQFPAMNAGTSLTPNMPCYDPEYKPYPFDVEQAKQYLSQSKYGPTGATVPKIRILTAGSDPSRIRATQIIQEMWRVNLGIEDVEIRNVESEFADGEGLVAMRVSSGGAPIAVPALALEEAAHSRGYAAQETTHYSTPELDATIDELLAMDASSPEYCSAIQSALAEIMEIAVVIPTAWWKSYYQIQPWVQDFDLGLFPEWIAGWSSDTKTRILDH
jgi:ABC-type transport system substrate-binding protein